jgi:chromosome segregation ATPase
MSWSLEERERALAREQEKWQTDKTERERTIDILEAKVKTLTPRAEELEGRVAAFSTAEESKDENLKRIEREIGKANLRLQNVYDAIGRTERESADLDKDLKSRKLTVTGVIDEWESQERAKAAERLAEVRQQVDNAETSLELLNQKIETAYDKLENVNSQVQDAEVEAEKRKTALLDEEAIVVQRVAMTGERAEDAERQTGVLLDRNAALEQKGADLQKKLENSEAYMKNAWSRLEAKDEELLAREQAVAQRENTRPSIKTFLPSL